MSLEFAYRFREDAAPSILHDLDVVAVLAQVPGDDGETIEAGTEGTIVSVVASGAAYVVEFDAPAGALATLPGDVLRLIGRVEG